MSTAINLRVINKSNDTNNTSYVIFQKNIAESFDDLSVAWKVITNLGREEYHPIVYQKQIEVSANDSWGNFTMPQNANYGDVFGMTKTSSGDQLEMLTAPASSPEVIEIKNNLPQGSIGANCFRSGSLLSTKSSLAPEQIALFEFKPIIYIGAVSQVEEGQVMNSAIISGINTEISLIGIQSADIIITGGGTGPNAAPFTFSLENEVYS